MESHGVEVIDLNLDECKHLMSEFIQNNPSCGTRMETRQPSN